MEMSKTRSRYNSAYDSASKGSGGTCGMKSSVSKSGENAEGSSVSAKRSFMANKFNSSDPSYIHMNESWPMEATEGCKHKEMPQDEVELKKSFGEWNADKEATEKYANASIDPEKALKYANTKAFHKTTPSAPRNSRTLGISGLRESAGLGVAKDVTFADSCVDFLQSDSYVQARSDNNKSCGR